MKKKEIWFEYNRCRACKRKLNAGDYKLLDRQWRCINCQPKIRPPMPEPEPLKDGANNHTGCCFVIMAVGASFMLSLWGVFKVI